MSNDDIRALARTVQDTGKPVEARRTALKHICALRGESIALVDTVAEDELSAVVAGMTVWSELGLRDLTLQDSLESVREGRARREAGTRR